MPSRHSLVAALTLLLIALPGSAQAVNWSDTFVGYRVGTSFREPNNRNDIRKDILQLTHSSGYSLGQNFINLDVFKSDGKDPVKGGTSGATEYYLTYRHQLLFSKVAGNDPANGLIRDFALTAGVDLNTKNSPVEPRKQLFVIGPTIKFNVPGFLDLSLLYALERNHNNFGTVHKSMTFDPGYMVSAAWGIPFSAGKVPLKFQGFINVIGPKGKDYSNVATATETLMRTSLMMDVGQMAFDKKNTFYLGVGYEYWRNKFGNHDKPGVNVSAPTLQVEWHFY